MSQPLKQSVELLKKEADDNFKQQGALYQGGGFVRGGGAFSNSGSRATTSGSAWAPLAPSTRVQRAKLGYSPARPILERTGKLRRGFRTFFRGGDTAGLKNIVSYGVFHQNGGRKLPQRKIIGITNKSALAIKLVFSNYFKTVFK